MLFFVTRFLVFIFLIGGPVVDLEAHMIEYDLVGMPDFEGSTGSDGPFLYKVQCPAAGRCFLRSNTVTQWGPNSDESFRDGSWSLADDSYLWFYYLKGKENMTPDEILYYEPPYVSGEYCDDNSTCTIICSEFCMCALESDPVVECVISNEYHDLELPAREDRTIYEFLLPALASEEDYDNGSTVQLRCPDFLNGCYSDTDAWSSVGSSYNTRSDYEGFFGIDYLSCYGGDDGTIPCSVGCDPGCSCTILDRTDNSTQECSIGAPSATPTTLDPSATPTLAPVMNPSFDLSDGGAADGTTTNLSYFAVMSLVIVVLAP